MRCCCLRPPCWSSPDSVLLSRGTRPPTAETWGGCAAALCWSFSLGVGAERPSAQRVSGRPSEVCPGGPGCLWAKGGMSLCSWPPRLGRNLRRTSAPLLRGRHRLTWLPWGAALAVTLVCPSPAGRSQRRRVSSTPGKEKPTESSNKLQVLLREGGRPSYRGGTVDLHRLAGDGQSPWNSLHRQRRLLLLDLCWRHHVPERRKRSCRNRNSRHHWKTDGGKGWSGRRLPTEGRVPGSYAVGLEGPGLCRGPPAEGGAGDGAGVVGEGWKLTGGADAEDQRGSLGTAREGLPPGTESGLTFCQGRTDRQTARQTGGREPGVGRTRADLSLPAPWRCCCPAGDQMPRQASAGRRLRAGAESWRAPARNWATGVWGGEAATEGSLSAPQGDAESAQASSKPAGSP